MLDYRYYLDAVRRDGDALLHAVGSDVTRPVPSCPGWTQLDLVRHLGGVYEFVVRQVRSAERVARGQLDVPDDEVLAAVADLHAELLLVLRETDPDAPSWTWSRKGPSVAAFWPRRMAHETAVHRWDAQLAVGEPAPMDPDLACDGVDEVLDVFLPARRGRIKEELAGTVHLHAIDASPTVAAEWTIDLGPAGAVAVRRVHEKADAALRGPAGELLLACWGRAATLDRFGDGELIEAIRAQ
jgi:uncharacterized protein (TIGR03083 family)